MHTNAQLIERFYAALGSFDAEAAAACYADDVVFSDPVFGTLKGERARDMWRMLLSRASDLEIAASDVEADDGGGSARWAATYTFLRTGRRVHNVIDARFVFRDGLIVRHEDDFPLWRWSRMAFGITGLVLGWTPWFRRRLRADALRGLERFEAERAEA